MSPRKIVLAFDAYGTLLSTESIARKLSEYIGNETASIVAAAWRKYQLEYTWRLNSMGIYNHFSTVTLQSLRHAAMELGVELDKRQTDELMDAYNSLSTFPDVPPMIEKLKEATEIVAVIFSNGTREMVSSSVNNSPDLAAYANGFRDIISVDPTQKFKPAPETYHHLAAEVGKDASSAEQLSEIWLISGNPFDVCGGRAVGMNAIWVDRNGRGWQDCLPTGSRTAPTKIVTSLDQVVDVVLEATGISK